INDFDQTQRGPWEWDVKRCAASIVLAGRVAGDNEGACKQAARLFLEEYSRWMRVFAEMPTLEVARHRAWRSKRDPLIRGALKEAERATPLANLERLTRRTKGHNCRFAIEPGLIWEVAGAEKKPVLSALSAYRNSLAPDRQLLFDRYQPVDVGF